MNKLGEFIQEELQNRHMSARQFAEYVDVSHTTITKAMYPVPPEPSLDFLAKLSRATGVDLCALVEMVKPNDTKVSSRALLIAQRIEQLPASKRAFADEFLNGLIEKRGQELLQLVQFAVRQLPQQAHPFFAAHGHVTTPDAFVRINRVA
jgi:transcriptional regulator with XRE-family HTH domain